MFHFPRFDMTAMPLNADLINDSDNRKYMQNANEKFRHRKSSTAFIRGSAYGRQAVLNQNQHARQNILKSERIVGESTALT
jgi:hypothetical protein